jgi:hypothetical protein
MGMNTHSLHPNDLGTVPIFVSTKMGLSPLSQLRLAVFLVALMILGGVRSGHVFAQADDANVDRETSWKEDTVDDSQRKNLSKIGEMLRSKEKKFATPAAQSDFDKYYQTYALPQWTQEKYRTDLPRFRKELFNNLSQAGSGQVHDRLNDLVLEYMGKLIKPNSGYHPAVCYNAMLTIGALNSVDGSNPIIPLDRTMPILLAAVNDPNQSEPMKIAALIGINRHVFLGVKNQQTQSQILALMIKFASADLSENPDPGREWMRKQAVEILGSLGVAGNNNQAAQTLSKIIGDAKISLYTRSAAAESLGKLKFTGAGGLNAAETVKNLGQLMFDACDVELKTAKAGDLPIERRRLRTILMAANDGLKNLATQAKDPAKTNIANLQKFFTDMDKFMDKNFSTLKDDPEALQAANDELKTAVETGHGKLEEWLKK